MRQSLWLLTKKNLKLLFRSKSSSLIVFFAPLLLILILGLSYNTSSQYGLNIGIYSTSFGEDANSVIELLQEQEFRIVKYEESIEECVKDIKSGAIHTCISLPENLQVEGNDPKEVTFYLDPSKINVVWMVQQTLQNKFDFKSQEISQRLTQDLLSRLTDASSKIEEKKGELNTVKDKSSAASTSVTSVKSGLEGANVGPIDNTYATDIVDQATKNIEDAIAKVAASKEEVQDANISGSVKSSVTVLLDEADDELDNALKKVNGTRDSVSTLVITMQSDLISMRDKLTLASETISGSVSSLSSASTSLQEAVTSLDSLHSALGEIQTGLAGQSITDAGIITAPLVTKIERVAEEGTYLNYTFPTLLILVIMFSSLLLGTILVMMEKNSPAFLRNYFLPLKKTTFIISIYLTTLILVLVQLLIILGISLFFIPETFTVIPAILIVLFLSASVFTFLGMTLGYSFMSEETGVLASISLGSLLLFLSGAILPIETISPAFREMMAFNPFVLSEKMVREVFIFNSSLFGLWVDLLILIGYAAVLFLIILIIESVLHKNLVHKFLKHHHKRHRQKDKINKNEV